MSLLDAADRAAMLEAVGDQAVCATGTVTVSFFAPGQRVDMFEGSVLVTDPSALIATADIEAHNLTGGADGSLITIDGRQYQIRSIVPDGDGFSMLELRESDQPPWE